MNLKMSHIQDRIVLLFNNILFIEMCETMRILGKVLFHWIWDYYDSPEQI